MKIYLAGPLFTWGERKQNDEIAAELRLLGHEVFVPQETEQRELSTGRIFRSDVDGMDWAECIVACMDGPDPDSGTCFELGYMFARNKPSVLYRSDFRNACGEGLGCMVNLMLSVAADDEYHMAFETPRAIALAVHQTLREIHNKRDEGKKVLQ